MNRTSQSPADPLPSSSTNRVVPLATRLAEDAFEEVGGIGAAPGHYLRLVLEHRQLSQTQLAARTGLSTKHINQVVQGLVPLSSETALLLERALNVPSRIWNDLEAAYQDSQARERSQQQLNGYDSWLKRFPLEELRSRRVIDPAADIANQVGQLLTFFQVADPKSYDRVWSTSVASDFRRAKHLEVDPFATAAWLRLAEQRADVLELAEYSQEDFSALLPTLRSLMLLDDDQQALASLQHQCAQVGVGVVFVREIKGARACGAARWPRPTNPMIVLSGRHRYADIFWFTFFHEAVHILLHPKRETYIDVEIRGDDSDGMEAQADRAAGRYLVGAQLAKKLRPGLRHDEVRRLADEAGVHVGIVAGQLCHALNDYQKYGKLRRMVEMPSE